MTVDKKQREKDKWLPVEDIIDEKNPIMFSIFKERPINNAHKSAMQSLTAGLKKSCYLYFYIRSETWKNHVIMIIYNYETTFSI